MKRVFSLTMMLICIISGSVFAQSGRTVTFDGFTYQVVTRPADFITAFKNQNPAAIIYKQSDYNQTCRDITSEAARQNIDVKQVYDPNIQLRAHNMQVIDTRPNKTSIIMFLPSIPLPSESLRETENNVIAKTENNVIANDELYMFNELKPRFLFSKRNMTHKEWVDLFDDDYFDDDYFD